MLTRLTPDGKTIIGIIKNSGHFGRLLKQAREDIEFQKGEAEVGWHAMTTFIYDVCGLVSEEPGVKLARCILAKQIGNDRNLRDIGKCLIEEANQIETWDAQKDFE